MVLNTGKGNKGYCYLPILACMLWLMPVCSQAQEVQGNIIDAKTSEALPGVNILVKGSTSGTYSTDGGHYSLEVSSLTDTLVFSFVGYKKKEIALKGRTNVDVQLPPKTYSGEEMVVVGYGKRKKEDLTGAISSVSSEELKNDPSNSLAGALSGRLAGVSITKNQGGPGAGARVRVRGTNSITQGNSPLYIVDGVEVDDALSVLSPSEIESVTVLKDAASTAIYGARASNGVILITTKSGASRPLRVTYNGFIGVRKIQSKLDVLNPYDFVKYQYQLYNFDGDPQMAQNYRDRYGRVEDFDIYHSIHSENWQDRVFGRAAMHSTNELTFSGGENGNTYHITLNHLGEDGIQIGSGFHRSLISFKYNHNTQESDFHFGLNTRYSRQGIDGQGTSASGSQTANHLRNAVRYKPYLAPGQQNEVDFFNPDEVARTNLVNPVLLVNNQIEHDDENELLLNGFASYDFTDHLTLKSRIGWVNKEGEDNSFDGPITSEARKNNRQPIVDMGRSNETTITNNNTLDYSNTIGEDHSIDVLLGQETWYRSSNSSDVYTKWLPANITADQAFANIQKANPPSGEVQRKPTTFESQATLLSYFGRIDYSYQSKYLATFTLRTDGSSKFPEENRYRTFPAGALAWRISNEDFMEDVDWVTNLKLRLSYGATGNNGIDNDLFKTTYQTSSHFNYAYENSVESGLGPNALANANIRWETTVSKNIGLDFSLFNDRLHGSIDAYINDANNLLLEKQIPVTSGFSEQIQNVGSTRNKGLELSLGGDIIENKDFQWSGNFNISANRNTIKSLGTDYQGIPLHSYLIQSGWVNNLQDFKVEVGEPVGQFYGYVVDGRYTVDDFNYNPSTEEYTLKGGQPNDSQVALGREDPQPGDIKLKDLSDDGDNTIGSQDKKVLGNAQPLFEGGLRQSFNYKGFGFSFLLNFAYGNDEYNANRIEFTTAYLYTDQNMLSSIADRYKWFNENGNKVTNPTDLKALNKNTSHWDPPHGQQFLRSSAIEDASYIRLSNITLSYSLPQQLLQRVEFLSQVRVYATVNNLYTFTNYSGYDPVASTRGSTLRRGVDYAAYPQSRFILGGINITF